LIESELFGYLRGSFTGAMQSKAGRVHAAQGGTLFLDEVGELPIGTQAKLLRFLQDGEVQRLGGNGIEHVDARVIAATNRDISHPSEKRPFRLDLYYRLCVFPIDLPPLRMRDNDVLQLGELFAALLCGRERRSALPFTHEFQERLLAHPWPGNIRELQHVIERACILAGDEKSLRLEHLPETLRKQTVRSR
jgi:transcriptional regulator with GAF, ATPase, and Fis domain